MNSFKFAKKELDDGGFGDVDGGGADLGDGSVSSLPPRHGMALRSALERTVRARRSDNAALAAPFQSFLATLLAGYAQFVVLNFGDANGEGHKVSFFVFFFFFGISKKN